MIEAYGGVARSGGGALSHGRGCRHCNIPLGSLGISWDLLGPLGTSWDWRTIPLG